MLDLRRCCRGVRKAAAGMHSQQRRHDCWHISASLHMALSSPRPVKHLQCPTQSLPGDMFCPSPKHRNLATTPSEAIRPAFDGKRERSAHHENPCLPSRLTVHKNWDHDMLGRSAVVVFGYIAIYPRGKNSILRHARRDDLMIFFVQGLRMQMVQYDSWYVIVKSSIHHS